jgi:hypothetical protein
MLQNWNRRLQSSDYYKIEVAQTFNTASFVYLQNMRMKDIIWFGFLITMIWAIPYASSGQSNNYWTRSFNEESSLLSGAVVGGGSGPSAIYYNPASISEVKDSKLSLNASLFSFDFINVKNALGDGIDLKSSRGNIEPRFISYMIKSKRFKNWSFEIAVLNNENNKSEITQSVDDRVDILTGIPGDERYFAFYQNSNRFRDDWIGMGGSVKLNDRLYAGISMFVTIKSLEYTHAMDIEAYSLNDSVFVDNEYVPQYVAAYESSSYLKFNDYRLTWKAGLLYNAENFSFGLSFTTPSLGGIYSDGKRITRKEKQSNITNPDNGEPLPDYVIVDYKEKKDVKVSYKTPFSLAAGITYKFPDRKRTLYSSVEFFSKTQPYRMVEAEESQDISTGNAPNDLLYNEWLSYASGARPVFNAAIGYSWAVKKDLMLMGGFRTDFNFKKNLDYGEFADYNKVQSINVDLYHITCGLSWNILGQDIITGIEYTVGRNKDQKQIANLSDPVEYNTFDNLPLQGIINNDMTALYNSISLYFGASFNFGDKKE